MDIPEVVSILDLANGAMAVPIRLYSDGQCIWRCKTSEAIGLSEEYDTKLLEDQLVETGNRPYFRLSEFGEMWASIPVHESGNKTFFLIGPVVEHFMPEDAIRQIVNSVDHPRLGPFLKIRDLLPLVQSTRFISITCLLYRLITGKSLEVTDLLKESPAVEDAAVFESLDASMTRTSEEAVLHDTERFERTLLELVSKGDVEKVQLHLGTAVGSVGLVSLNPLRQEKDMFIVSTAIVARAALTGGLPSEITYSLSDAYIQRCENLKSLQALKVLFPTMIIDYTRRVRDSKLSAPLSPLMRKVANYLSIHLSEDIDAASLAEEFGYSRSYFSRLFMSEIGMSIPAYIARERITKSKDLLLYTESSVAEIAGLVGIGTPSRFIALFKQETGQTPLQYRRSSSS
jgi:AraC-like DNA-binding protein